MPGTLTPVRSHSKPISSAGIDVAKLLRDIGEASASTDPVELFCLCLDAQHALAQVQSSSASNKDEADLLAAYRAADDWGRDFIRHMAISQAQKHPRQRPVLKLVQSVHAQRAEAV